MWLRKMASWLSKISSSFHGRGERGRNCSACVQAVASERERIYQDIHDGIGSRLVAALFYIRQSTAPSPVLERQLQRCLDDLRLVVSTRLDNSRDIQSAVFEYCLSMEEQLKGGNLAIEYEIDDNLPINLPPQMHVDVLRILQESMANVMKHSGATMVFIKLEQTETDAILAIADNGIGLPMELTTPNVDLLTNNMGGRGLLGLVARAKRWGGQCVLSQTNPGTRILLTIPIKNIFVN